ncbi:MAG: imidazolonepropionase [Acidobacteria bacterium]|nr:imidazolonepropionase [Acidobacteriota bacterium]
MNRRLSAAELLGPLEGDMKPESAPKPILLLNIGQLVTIRSLNAVDGPRRGVEFSQLGIIEDGAVLCLGGRIVAVGTTRDALRDSWLKKHKRTAIEIDCHGRVVLPGFVDSHTHPAFLSPRLTDFERRLAGATYEQIAKAGGGIRSSVESVRRAREQRLTDQVLSAMNQAAEYGTTTIEAKSGYGLSLAGELKSLQAIRAAAGCWSGTVLSTLLGAHVVPREFERQPGKYIALVCNRMIPKAAERKLADFVDVFCDSGAFSEEDSLAILASARKNGFQLRAHVSQLTRSPLARLLSLGPRSLDHLDKVNQLDVVLLAKSNTVATLLPAANYFLGLRHFPPARELIDAGVAVALATDYNPGSAPTISMQFVLSLACTQMKMTPGEAIVAATINGACALGLAARKGSITPGKDADLALFDVADYREIPYWAGGNRCQLVLTYGRVVQSRR